MRGNFMKCHPRFVRMKISSLKFLAASAAALISGCQTARPIARAPRIAVPQTAHVIRVDGHLDEAPCLAVFGIEIAGGLVCQKNCRFAT